MPPAAPPPEAGDPSARPRPRNPWWIPPFLGRVPVGLDDGHLGLIGLIALGLTFEQYDLSLLNTAIGHVATDLGFGVGEIGRVTAAVRAGGLLTFLVVPFADRVGRRRLFLISLACVGFATSATAFAQTPLQFVAIQVVGRAGLLTSAVMGVVILVEELPAAHRGWGLGMAAAVSAMGYGVGLGVFAAVESLPYGWRALYLLGCLPLVLLPFFRRNLSETARFAAHRAARATETGSGSWLRPVLELARTSPRRALVIGTVALGYAVGGIVVFQFVSPFAQEVHGWRPWQVSVVLFGGGLIGITGNVIAGSLADRFGRRWVGCGALTLYPAAVAAFYLGSGWTLPVGWVLLVLFGTAGDVVLRAVATEVFPTAHRSTAMGWMVMLQTVGWTLGLLVGGARIVDASDIGPVASGLSLVMVVAGLALLALPESGRRELEVVSGD